MFARWVSAWMTIVASACSSADPQPKVAPREEPPPSSLSAPAPAPAPAPTPTPAVAPPTLPTPTHPVGAIDIPCMVRAEIEPTIVNNELRLRYVLKNVGREDATVTLRGPCPRGLVELRGLPAGFDPAHTCQAGACPTPEQTATFVVPAGGAPVAIGSTTLELDGDACNPPWPLGSTVLTAAIVADAPQVHVCSGESVHLIRDGSRRRLRRAQPNEQLVPSTPAPPPATKKPAPPPKKTAPTKPRRPCPTCGFGCKNNEVPKRGVDENGCPFCGCEDALRGL